MVIINRVKFLYKSFENAIRFFYLWFRPEHRYPVRSTFYFRIIQEFEFIKSRCVLVNGYPGLALEKWKANCEIEMEKKPTNGAESIRPHEKYAGSFSRFPARRSILIIDFRNGGSFDLSPTPALLLMLLCLFELSQAGKLITNRFANMETVIRIVQGRGTLLFFAWFFVALLSNFCRIFQFSLIFFDFYAKLVPHRVFDRVRVKVFCKFLSFRKDWACEKVMVF